MKKDDNIIIKAYKYPLILSKKQEKLIRSWMEQEKHLYNFFIQKRQYLKSLKNKPSEYEREYKKGFAKTERGKQNSFSWKAYWSCVYKELVESERILRMSPTKEQENRDYWRFASLGDPKTSLPSTVVENSCGTIDNVFKAYKSLWDDRKKKKKRKKNNPFHPEQKAHTDDTSLPCGIKDGNFKIAIQGNSTARIIGFSKISMGKRAERDDPEKSLKIHYPQQRRIPNDAKVTQLRIIKEGELFFLNITFEKYNDSLIDENRTLRPSVGIDLGTDNKRSKNFVSMSDGSFDSYHNYESCRQMERLNKKKRRMQKLLRNKKGGNKNKREKQSNNYRKAQAKIAKIDARIAATRQYHSKMMASNLSKKYSVISMENLSIGNMTASAKGTQENPGKNVKAKAGLNRVILNVAPYAFKQNIINKAKEFGTEILQVDPRYTSQRCHKCGFICPQNRRGIRFKCLKCQHETHADTNAAKNIKELGESGLESVKELSVEN